MKLSHSLYILVLLFLVKYSNAGIFSFLEGSSLGNLLFINKEENTAHDDGEDFRTVSSEDNISEQVISSSSHDIDEKINDPFKVKSFDLSSVMPDENYDEVVKLKMFNEFVGSYFDEYDENGSQKPTSKTSKNIQEVPESSEIPSLKSDDMLNHMMNYNKIPSKTRDEIQNRIASKLPISQDENSQQVEDSVFPNKAQEAYFEKDSLTNKAGSHDNKMTSEYFQDDAKEIYKEPEEEVVVSAKKYSSKEMYKPEATIDNYDEEDNSVSAEMNEDSDFFFDKDIDNDTPELLKKRENNLDEDSDCMPQNLEEFARNANFDNNHITVKYFKENEVDEILNMQKRDKEKFHIGLESLVEEPRRSTEFRKYSKDTSKNIRKSGIKKEKTQHSEEELKIKHNNLRKPEKKFLSGNRQSKSDIKIINNRPISPSNTNSRLSRGRIDKKMNLTNQKKNIPKDMWQYVLTDEDNYFSSLKDFSDTSKQEWKDYIFYDSKDQSIDWAQYDDCDTYEEDYDDFEKIKKFVHEKLNTIKQEKKQVVGEIINISYHLNDGKHKGLNFLFEAVGMLTEEVFLVLKTLIVLMHRLTEAGFDGIKLVLQTIIDGENMILTQFEDDCTCSCDCLKKKGHILNHLNLLFFFHPAPSTTYKSTEIVNHLKELFGIHENPGDCWCDCYCDDKKSNFFKSYNLPNIELETSPFMINALYQVNTENAAVSSSSNVVNIANLHKKKRMRHNSGTLEKRKVNADFIKEHVLNLTTKKNNLSNSSLINVKHDNTNQTILKDMESFAWKYGMNYLIFLAQFAFLTVFHTIS